MKILLLKFIPKIGNQGDVVDVSSGYAKNALFPKKLAVLATPAVIQEWEHKKEKQKKEKEERVTIIKKIIPELQKHLFEFKVKTGDGGAVFTSIHQDDIQKAIAEFLSSQSKLLGIEDVHIEIKPIKELGEHKIQTRIGREDYMQKVDIKIQVR
jgi:large subunit ribosomal protein L9